jgi:hypothetical protein
MTIPNIVNVSSIYAKTHQVALVTDTTTALLTNAADSDDCYKINSIVIANIDGTNSATVTMGIVKSGGSLISFATTIAVPADATLVLVDKNWGLYLEEGDAIQGGASATGDLTCTISYEILDDA